MSEISGQSKDRLFRYIFGRPENRAWTLSLYNAVNGTNYTDPDAIRVTTVENAVYMAMKNDLSFLIADTMNFYEHQSTYNPNMPIRMMIYAGMVYSKYVDDPDTKINLYSSRQQMLPVPRLVCFYNGLKEEPDETVLRLSSAFPEGSQADMDVRVRMLNINDGRNTALMDACAPLRDYARFVAYVRASLSEGQDAEEAVSGAIERLPESSPIRPFLTQNKAEVKRMSITEYDEVRTMNLFKEEYLNEGRREGHAEGRSEERILSLRRIIKNLHLTPEQAMDALMIPQEERKSCLDKLS